MITQCPSYKSNLHCHLFVGYHKRASFWLLWGSPCFLIFFRFERSLQHINKAAFSISPALGFRRCSWLVTASRNETLTLIPAAVLRARISFVILLSFGRLLGVVRREHGGVSLSSIYGATHAASHELPGRLSNSPATHANFKLGCVICCQSGRVFSVLSFFAL
jgi:hypothetical protein